MIFENLRAGKKQTIVVYGTSLTHGGAWAVAVRIWFETLYPGQVTFINSGSWGQHSGWGLANLKDQVLAHKPDLVFIEFSYNDSVEKFAMPVAESAANLDTMVKAIREQNIDALVVLHTMNVEWIADAPEGYSSRPELETYNDIYRHYAKKEGLPLLDNHPRWQRLKETDFEKFKAAVPDGQHPSIESSLEISWPVIREFLEKSRLAAEGKV